MKTLLSLVVATAAALALTPTAQPASVGCIATVGITPAAISGEVGTPWVVTLRVLRHGRTPVPDARPVVRIRKAGAKQIAFRAVPTSRVGSYRARVVFPTAGRYAVSVYDGYPVRECARLHTFGSMVVIDA